MTSRTTSRFRESFARLPRHIQGRARLSFRQFLQDPGHPGLQFKQVHRDRPIFSARVGLGHRALAVREDDVWIWFWIGSHSDYDQLLRTL